MSENKPKRITQKSHDGAFRWLLESEDHASDQFGLSVMVRELINEHNKVLDELTALKEAIKMQDA